MRRLVYFLVPLLLLTSVYAQDPQPTPTPPTPPTPIVVEPTLTLPDEIKGLPGAFIAVRPSTNCEAVQFGSPDELLNVFPSDMLRDPRSTVIGAQKDGVYRLGYVGVLNGQMTPLKYLKVTIGNPTPTPTPDPQPTPDPNPLPPDPFEGAYNAAAPTNYRVLIIYESSQLSSYPKETMTILYSTEPGSVRDYLATNCTKDSAGLPQWRVWDQNVVPPDNLPAWKKAMARPRSSLPWIVIGTGKTGYEGKLPSTTAETLELLRKWHGV